MIKAQQILDFNAACRLHVARARRAFPKAPLLDALVAESERNLSPLSEKSVSVYVHEHRTMVRRLIEEGLASQEAGVTALGRILPALKRRCDPKVPPRTSALKSTEVTAGELKLTFDALKVKALAGNDTWVALVGLTVVAAVTLGARPMELPTLQRVGHYLRVQTAKRSARAAPHRVYDVRRVPRSWLAAMQMVAEIWGECGDVDEFYRLLRHLSQILGRVSEATIGRRLCFYTLRHVSLATWKRAGIAALDIALLAGHISVRTARHYAPAEAGHAGTVLIRPVAADAVPEGLFEERAPSPLMRPPRGPRRRDWTMQFADQLESDAGMIERNHAPGGALLTPGEVLREASAVATPDADTSALALTDCTDAPASEPIAAKTAFPAEVAQSEPRPDLSQAARERAYRQAWLQRGVRIVGPLDLPPTGPLSTAPLEAARDEDGFDLSDMPMQPAPPKSRGGRPIPAPPPITDADRAIDTLIEVLADSGTGDLAPGDGLAMPLPYQEDANRPMIKGTGNAASAARHAAAPTRAAGQSAPCDRWTDDSPGNDSNLTGRRRPGPV